MSVLRISNNPKVEKSYVGTFSYTFGDHLNEPEVRFCCLVTRENEPKVRIWCDVKTNPGSVFETIHPSL